MRIFILENCVFEGSVWFGGEEVYVDEAMGKKMVEEGKAREMGNLPPAPPLMEGGIEMRVVKAKERAVGARQRAKTGLAKSARREM